NPPWCAEDRASDSFRLQPWQCVDSSSASRARLYRLPGRGLAEFRNPAAWHTRDNSILEPSKTILLVTLCLDVGRDVGRSHAQRELRDPPASSALHLATACSLCVGIPLAQALHGRFCRCADRRAEKAWKVSYGANVCLHLRTSPRVQLANS